jgi:hypothetical protein
MQTGSSPSTSSRVPANATPSPNHQDQVIAPISTFYNRHRCKHSIKLHHIDNRGLEEKQNSGAVQTFQVTVIELTQLRRTWATHLMAVPPQKKVKLLKNLPPEILHRIFSHCTDDVALGRKALLSLSAMNKYFRRAATAQLFKHNRFCDLQGSAADEILDSIRAFMATPKLSRHARTVSLYLNRETHVWGTDDTEFTEPYHHLVLSEFVKALAKILAVAELYIEVVRGSWQGRRCLEWLKAAVDGCSGDPKITAFIVRANPRETLNFTCNWVPYSSYTTWEVYNSPVSLETFPHLTSFSFEGTHWEASGNAFKETEKPTQESDPT